MDTFWSRRQLVLTARYFGAALCVMPLAISWALVASRGLAPEWLFSASVIAGVVVFRGAWHGLQRFEGSSERGAPREAVSLAAVMDFEFAAAKEYVRAANRLHDLGYTKVSKETFYSKNVLLHKVDAPSFLRPDRPASLKIPFRPWSIHFGSSGMVAIGPDDLGLLEADEVVERAQPKLIREFYSKDPEAAATRDLVN